MEIFRPALDRFTSSVASTAIFTRVMSFTGSFNDRTSLLLETGPAQALEEPGPPPPQAGARESAAAASAPATTIVHTFDMEAAATPLAPSAPDGQSTQDVQPVFLFTASASLLLFFNLPGNSITRDSSKPPGADAAAAAEGEGHGALYSADLAFIGLGFFSSLALTMLSVVANRPGVAAVVARVQKWGVVAAVASVIVAFSLRMCMMPVA